MLLTARKGLATVRLMPLILFINLASRKWSTVRSNIVQIMLEKMQFHVGECKREIWNAWEITLAPVIEVCS
jgi:hypothetical protein